MSYEGYTQCICESGHYFDDDAYSFEEPICHCGKKAAWTNGVDQTNGPSEGEVLYEDLVKHFLIKDYVFETCNLEHKHLKEQAVFRIPTKEETDLLCKYSYND